jgi:hypothetical protein
MLFRALKDDEKVFVFRRKNHKRHGVGRRDITKKVVADVEFWKIGYETDTEILFVVVFSFLF